jgi:hypothetical protein
MAGYFGRGRPITGINTYTKTQSDDRFRDSISGDMLPDSDDTRDLGSSSKAWAEAYVNNLTVAGNAIATAGSLSNRNKIINGNFDIWQRGTSGSSGYVADRWTTAVSGSTAAISRQSFTLGQTDVPGEPNYYHRTVVTSSAGASNYVITEQRIESVKTLAGQTATLSFWAKADASKNMAVEFAQYFGTGGSQSTVVIGIGVTTIALTTSWQKFTVTVDVPSISGKTLGTNNDDNFRVLFWFDAGSNWDSRTNTLGQQSGTFDIARVQLEAGDTATPFEHRSYGQELALCQRYYIQYDENDKFRAATAATGTSSIEGLVSLPVQMRATPTVTTSTDIFNVVRGITNADRAISGTSGTTSKLISVTCASGSATSGTDTGIIYTNTGQFVKCSAEL